MSDAPLEGSREHRAWAEGESTAAFGYTLATGRLFMAIAEFHREFETLMGRSVFTHEFADAAVWQEARDRFEATVTEEATRL